MLWHESVEAFVSAACSQVRWKKARAPIAQELRTHIEDQAAAFISQGMGEEEAAAKAVASMGDPIHTGTLLDASWRPRPPWAVLFIIGGLVALGFFARSYLLHQPADMNQIMALVLGLGGLFFLYCLDWRHILRATWAAYGVLAAASLLGSHGLETLANGRFFFGRSLISCLMLFFPVVYGLIIYRFRGKGLPYVLLCGVLFGVSGIIWIDAADFSVVMRTALPCLALLTIAILGGHFNCSKWKALLLVWGGTVATSILLAVADPYGMRRVIIALPWLADFDPMYAGYFPNIIRGLLEHARLFGQGAVTHQGTIEILGRYADMYRGGDLTVIYALSLFIHQYGWWVLFALAGFLSWLFFLLFRACRRQGSMLGKLLGYGAVLSLLVQFVGYILSNLGFVLFDSLPLPFLTYGNSSLMVNLWLCGLMAAVLAGGCTLRDGQAGMDRNKAKDCGKHAA